MAVFSPTFAEEIFVYCILADLENRIRYLNIGQSTPTKFESVFDYETVQKTSAPPRTTLGRAQENYLMSNDLV